MQGQKRPQSQKRTRSSGPVSLFVIEHHQQETQQSANNTDSRYKKQKKEKVQTKNDFKQSNPPVHKQINQKPHKYYKRPEEKTEKTTDKREDQNKNEVLSKSKKAQDSQKMQQLISRFNRVKQKNKKAQQMEQQKPIDKPQESKDDQIPQPMPQKKKSEKDFLVDLHFSKGKQVKVYVDAKNFGFSVTLNHSDVSKNINKFYIMQVLQQIARPEQYYLYTRWGRVGLVGNKAEAGPITLEQALQMFRAKVQQKIQHKYTRLETTVEDNRRNYYFPSKEKKNTPVIQSKLDPRVQNLIKVLFDGKLVNNQLQAIGFDSKRMPLGKVAPATIIKGYEALKQILDELRGKRRKQIIDQSCNKFYSNIPHDFGMKNLSNYALDTEAKVRVKLQMLQSIQDMQLYNKILSDPVADQSLNILDSNYLKLNYEIKPLDKDTPTHSIITKYVSNTHAPSHNHYKLEVDTIYQLTSKKQSDFRQDLGNRFLLWHGSRLTNFVGILNNGLRIAPPQAPVTGYMFGKGVYFADVVSKSANYCYASKKSPVGCLLLCEVALGNYNQKCFADYYANLLPEDLHSVKGVGKMAPQNGQKLEDIYVPNGPLAQTGISNTSLHYNEYVVYNVNQIRCRFLLQTKFVFK